MSQMIRGELVMFAAIKPGERFTLPANGRIGVKLSDHADGDGGVANMIRDAQSSPTFLTNDTLVYRGPVEIPS